MCEKGVMLLQGHTHMMLQGHTHMMLRIQTGVVLLLLRHTNTLYRWATLMRIAPAGIEVSSSAFVVGANCRLGIPRVGHPHCHRERTVLTTLCHRERTVLTHAAPPRPALLSKGPMQHAPVVLARGIRE